MKSKITNIEQVGEFSNDHGQFYTYEYTFENGESGQAAHKTQGVDTLKNKKGDEKEFEITTNDHGSKIKWIKDEFTPSSKGKSYGKSIEEQWQIARNSGLTRAEGYFASNEYLEETQYGTKTSQQIDVAEIYANYIMNGK